MTAKIAMNIIKNSLQNSNCLSNRSYREIVCKLPKQSTGDTINVYGSDISVNIIDFVTTVSGKREMGIGKRGLEADDSFDDSGRSNQKRAIQNSSKSKTENSNKQLPEKSRKKEKMTDKPVSTFYDN